MRFGDYIQLLEMAKVAEADKIYLDDADMEYLRQFPKEGWSSALQYRYGSKVLLHPEPEVRDIPYTVPIKKEGKNVAQSERLAKQVKVFAKEVIDKLTNKNYDINKFELGRNAANTMIKKVLEGKKADFNPPKEFKVGQEQAPKRQQRYEEPTDFTRTSREKIPLDQYDKEFLDYFDKDPRFSRYKTQAMQMRYSNDLINHPRAGDYMTLTFRKAGGGIVKASMVPVHVDQLRKKIENLKNNGIQDFTRYGSPMEIDDDGKMKPTGQQWMPAVAAKRWMVQGWYQPGYKEEKFKASGEKIRISDKLQSYIDKQDAYLKGQGESPNIPDSKIKDKNEIWSNRNKTWVEILKDDADIAAYVAIRARIKYSDKPKAEFLQFLQSHEDEIAGDIFDHLTDSDTVSKMGVRYGSEEARKLIGRTKGDAYIKKEIEPLFSRPKDDDEKGRKGELGDQQAYEKWRSEGGSSTMMPSSEKGPEEPIEKSVWGSRPGENPVEPLIRQYLVMELGADKIVGPDKMKDLVQKVLAAIKAEQDKYGGRKKLEQIDVYKIAKTILNQYRPNILKMQQQAVAPEAQPQAQHYSFGGRED